MGPDCGGVSAVTMTENGWAATSSADVEPVEASGITTASPSAALAAMSAYSGAGSTLNMASAVSALVDEIIESAETEAVSELYDMYEEALSGKEIENGEEVEKQDKNLSENNGVTGQAKQSDASSDLLSALSQTGGTSEVQSAVASPNVVASAAQADFDTADMEHADEAVAPAASV